jgi:hypothetical protein
LPVLDHSCPEAGAHEVRSALFPDAEQYVRNIKTVVTYGLDLTSGSAALDAKHPSFSTLALSVAVVAGRHPWRLWRRRSHATDFETIGHGHLSLGRAGWTRLAVVFCFGLVHGLGFVSALGIDQPTSWALPWSPLVFNVGIEAVQLAIIMVAFPWLALMRHHRPVAGLWTAGAIAAVWP